MASGGLKLLFDENFSHRQVEFLARESGLAHMQHMRNLNWSGRPDREWIPDAVRANFVILSGDRNEKTRGYTASDLKSMRAKVILLSQFWDHLDRWEKAKWLVARIEVVVEMAAKLRPGTVHLIDRTCKAKVL